MATILPASTAPAPGYLTPDFRYAGDDWTGSNALLYVVWTVAPVLAADGTVATPGTPRDLTGCTVSGVLRFNAIFPYTGNIAGAGILVEGAIVGDPTQGEISLSLPQAQTNFAPQQLSAFGNPSQAGFLAQPMVTGPDGALVSIGLQPLYVF